MSRSRATINLFKSDKWRHLLDSTATALRINLILFSAGAEELLSVNCKCPDCGSALQTFDISEASDISALTGSADHQAREIFRLDEKYLVAARDFTCCHTGSTLDFREKVNIAKKLLIDYYNILFEQLFEGQLATGLMTLRQTNRIVLSMFRGDGKALERAIDLILSTAIILFDASGCWLEYSTEGERHLLTKGSIGPNTKNSAIYICKTVAVEIHSPVVEGILGIISPVEPDRANKLLDDMVNECVIIFEIDKPLKRMESKLSLVLNAMDNMVLLADRRKHICFANKAAAHLLNCPIYELIGLPVCAVDTPWCECIMSESEKVTKGVKDFLLCSHDERFVDWEVYPLSGSLDMPGWLIMARDRTEYYRLQELTERTENFVHASTLLRAIAHEIRNPMTTFIGLLQIIDLKCGTPEISKYVGIGMNEIKKLTLLLDEFSQSGKMADTALEMTDVKAFMEEVYSLVVTGFDGPDIEIAASFSAVTPVMIDKRQMTMALFNLVKNAFEALNRKGKIELQLNQRDRDWVAIRISDNGPGISDTIKDKLFKPFFSTKTDGTGLGLGLAIVCSIITNHNGKIFVHNSAEGGACFEILLPSGQLP